MRRMVAGVALLLTVLAGGGLASAGHATPQQWAIVNFSDPLSVRGHFLMGSYLVVHDDERMAKGEPCTSIYQFDRSTGKRALEVEFMCEPIQKEVCDKTTFSVKRDNAGINQLTEYQFAGDSEAHGVPIR